MLIPISDSNLALKTILIIMSAASFSAPVAASSYVGLKPNSSKLFQVKDSVAWNRKTVSNGSKTHCMKVSDGKE